VNWKFCIVFCQSVFLIGASGGSLFFESPQSAGTPPVGAFHRQYREGEAIKYHMKGKNEAWQYEIDGNGVVEKNAAGAFVEEIGWSELHSGGAALPIPPESAAFRQELSLDPAFGMRLPDFSKVSPMLIGPMADLMTFYSDLWLAGKMGNLSKVGDHAYIPMSSANSWADGSRVVLGEDSIDFDLTFKEIDQSAQTAKLLVRHVPPKEPKIKLPAEWMKKPVADTPNNWVEVAKNGDKYVAEVGKEIFDVEIVVSLRDGRMLSATLENPVKAIRRECSDAALTSCGEATPRDILRQITVRSVE
jgi:hypothetical protein